MSLQCFGVGRNVAVQGWVGAGRRAPSGTAGSCALISCVHDFDYQLLA